MLDVSGPQHFHLKVIIRVGFSLKQQNPRDSVPGSQEHPGLLSPVSSGSFSLYCPTTELAWSWVTDAPVAGALGSFCKAQGVGWSGLVGNLDLLNAKLVRFYDGQPTAAPSTWPELWDSVFKVKH